MLVHVPRQRQLHEDAVDKRVGVELADGIDELFRAHALLEDAVDGMEANLGSRALFHAHEGLRVGAIAHKHDRQSGHDAVRALQLLGLLTNLGTNLRSNFSAVDYPRPL